MFRTKNPLIRAGSLLSVWLQFINREGANSPNA